MRFRTIGLLAIGSIGLWGCPQAPEYPIEPAISFKDFYTDASDPTVGYLSINFTDGDGDIGLREDMTDAPFDTSSVYYYNMFAEFQTFNHSSNSWEYLLVPGPGGTLDTTIFKFRVPYLTPEGKNKALKGSIQVKLSPYTNDVNDSIRYRIKLIDRELNESNWIESPIIYKGIVLD